MKNKLIPIVILALFSVVGAIWLPFIQNQELVDNDRDFTKNIEIETEEANTHQETVVAPTVERKVLNIPVHYFQTFNNCGPATLAMGLSYYGINISQEVLGDELRPYQVSSGVNDDKSVTFEELGEKARELGLLAYHRPVGSIVLIEKLVSNNIPVLVRTWTSVDEDIGHYRVVRGYDQVRKVIIQDDSLQGKEIEIGYADFLKIWEKFNYEYLVLVEEKDKALVEQIIGDSVNREYAWLEATRVSQEMLKDDPGDIYARFNYSVALYHLGDYQGSIYQYELVRDKLPFRTLWYQIEPLLAYKQKGEYDEVIRVSSNILDNGNRVYSELYQLRGEIYYEQGKYELARQEFENAIMYNVNYEEARSWLDRMSR